MAKWGEGDPRWLVEDRTDGVNPNQWHWDEKDRMIWSRQRIAELVTGVSVTASPLLAEISIKRVEKVEGEAAVSQRKGSKKLAVYDLTLELEWCGKMSADAAEVVGRMKISEYASHSEEDDYIIECTRPAASGGDSKGASKASGSDADWDALYQLARTKLQPAVIAALKPFPADLLATYESA